MRTTKPISTISYNSPAFLEQKLNELLKAKRISFWAFIPHHGEDDEAGKKDHIHVHLVPSKMLQTDDLKDELKEFDPTHPTKPLGCMTFVSSKWDDWYLYGLHDRRYLAMKGQTRRHTYKHESFRTSDEDELLCKARQIDMIALSPYADMEDAIDNGITWSEYFRRGTIPITQLHAWQTAWELLAGPQRTFRAGRESHYASEEAKAYRECTDPSTGEVSLPFDEHKE